jgi:uncharacterized protein YaaN involved in tellurite resistance
MENIEKTEIKAIDLKAVKPEIMTKAQLVVQKLDVSKQDTVTNLGLETQQQLSSLNGQMLDDVRAKDSGDIGETINSLLCEIGAIDVDLKPSPLENIPVVGSLLAKMFTKGKEFVSKYESVKKNINGIVLKLEESRLGLRKDNQNFQHIFEKNIINIQELEVAIVAGKIKIEELKNTIATFTPEDGIEDYQKRDTVSYLERLEKKVENLQFTRISTIQSLPQIRLIQGNNMLLEDKIISSINNTIPIWRQQLVLGLGIQRQKKVLEIAMKMDKATNEMIEKNSQNLKFNTIEAAKANERSAIDINVLRKVNSDIVSTLDELIKIKEEGKNLRKKAEEELVLIESDLKSKILSIKQGTTASDATPLIED